MSSFWIGSRGLSVKEYIRNQHSIETQPDIIVLDVRPEIKYAAEAAGADDFRQPKMILQTSCWQFYKIEKRRTQEQPN